MLGQLGHLCCRHRPGEWGERSLPRRTQRCETDGSRGHRASLIKANFDREFEHTVYCNEVCNALYSNTGQLNVVLKHVFALLIWVECNEDVKEFNDVKKTAHFFPPYWLSLKYKFSQ